VNAQAPVGPGRLLGRFTSVGHDMVTLFLCGDVMTGRGIDQILPHPGDPRLREAHIPEATGYVALAEAASGPIPRPVDPAWPWGDTLTMLDEAAPDARLINLETSITRSGDFAPGKPVHYRMSPANIGCLTVARPDVCALANNHVMDFGRGGLAQTLDTLAGAGLQATGAGLDAAAAQRAAVVSLAGGGRVTVISCGAASSGIPRRWAAGASRPGVHLLPSLSRQAAARLADRALADRRPGDIVVISLHWGSNWGYGVGRDQAAFAHWLIEGGVDLVHGHSSHHPRPIEVYRGRLILYGCGDFIDDYEGITGYREYRDDLRLAYFASLRRGTGELAGLRMIPLQSRRLRLSPAGEQDRRWLAAVIDRASRPFGSRVELAPDDALLLRPALAPGHGQAQRWA
jgi:poly-gamma-glutamate capsule biosynthesis protein CapA/YwtB (metallophosphatase superfamily)